MVRIVLVVDAIINFALGLLLLVFSSPVVRTLGVPPSASNFYPNILGAVFIGITIALLIAAYAKEPLRYAGLGIVGAVSINLCGGIVLALWLIFGSLEIPTRGAFFLWALVVVLIILSGVELVHFSRETRRANL